MDSAFYVNVKGKKYGPFSREKLDALLQARKITIETPVCSADNPEWSSIGVLFASPETTPENVAAPEPAPAAVVASAPMPDSSRKPTHYASIILLGTAAVIGTVIFWLDLYLPALKLSLCVVTASAVALVLKFLIAVAFSRIENDSARNSRLVQLVLVAVTGGSLLGGLGWYERSALARTKSTQKSQVAGSSSLADAESSVAHRPTVELARQPEPPPRRPEPASPSAVELAELQRQQENEAAMQFLGLILQGAANDHARSRQGQPCAACGGTGSYSYVDGGRLQLRQCPHCSGSGKKWGGGLFGPQ